MNAKQKNKVQSHKTRLQLLKSAPAIALIKGLPAKITTYGRILGEVDELGRAQMERTGLMSARSARFAEMRDAALAISGVALSYADDKEDVELADKVRLTSTDIQSAPWAERMQIVQNLHAAVLPHVPALQELGIIEESMEDLQVKIDAATQALVPLRGAAVDKRAVTEEIDVAIRKLDRLERIHIFPLLAPLKKSSPEVYRRYLISREVIDRPGTRSDKAPDSGADGAPATNAEAGTPAVETPAAVGAVPHEAAKAA